MKSFTNSIRKILSKNTQDSDDTQTYNPIQTQTTLKENSNTSNNSNQNNCDDDANAIKLTTLSRKKSKSPPLIHFLIQNSSSLDSDLSYDNNFKSAFLANPNNHLSLTQQSSSNLRHKVNISSSNNSNNYVPLKTNPITSSVIRSESPTLLNLISENLDDYRDLKSIFLTEAPKRLTSKPPSLTQQSSSSSNFDYKISIRDSKQKNPEYTASFDFLNKCSEAEIDLTSLDAMNMAPQDIRDNIAQWIKDPDNDYNQYYGLSHGRDFLIDTLAKYFQKRGIACNKTIWTEPKSDEYGEEIDAEISGTVNNIALHSAGIMSAVKESLDICRQHNKDRQKASTVRHTDFVLIPTPTFGPYIGMVHNMGMSYKTIATEHNNFLPSGRDLEDTIDTIRETDPNTNFYLLLCYPNNPTGAVMTEQAAREIAQVAKDNKIYVISDEAFLMNTLGKEKHFSITAIPEMLDTSIAITSLAKSMSVQGTDLLREAICVGGEGIIDHFRRLGGFSFPIEKTFSDVIKKRINHEHGQGQGDPYFQQNELKCSKNIGLANQLVTHLNQVIGETLGEPRYGKDAYIKPVTAQPQTGGPYLIDFSGLHDVLYQEKPLVQSGLMIAEWLLEKAKVAVVPGECYLFKPERMVVRISLSKEEKILVMAFNRMIESAHTITEIPELAKTLHHSSNHDTIQNNYKGHNRDNSLEQSSIVNVIKPKSMRIKSTCNSSTQTENFDELSGNNFHNPSATKLSDKNLTQSSNL